ncbi:carbohydrate ABC transporter permease [uncultured Bosea sp.]|uniref:carbohydrate ABC transporter permease n=1 Tax=uncultured Bosea sp. TaxID=211457 RepID=UPI00345B69BA
MTAPLAAPREDASAFTRDRAMWGAIMLAPYVLVFAVMVVYPVAYGLWLGLNWNSYRALFADPIFIRTVVNTIVFLFVAVNLKFLIALGLSGFFVQQRPWIRIVLVLFILPWAVPSIPTILSFRVMLNPENGMLNQQLFQWFGIMEGPGWLTDPTLAFMSSIFVHIWKSLPFWTLILITGRLAIAADLYEAASVDGANRWQQFRFITWPSLATLYVTSTMLSMIWTLGDFNSVYLLTGGGPGDLNHVLATLGIRYMRNNNLDLGIASIIVAMPLILPMVFVMVKRLSKGPDA